MAPIMENVVRTSTTEINADGGWLIRHYTQTWDERTRLDEYNDIVATKQAALAKAQAEYDEAMTKKVEVDAELAKKIIP